MPLKCGGQKVSENCHIPASEMHRKIVARDRGVYDFINEFDSKYIISE